MSDEQNKPAVAAKTEAVEYGTNHLKLPWPQDPQGALSALKKGGVTAARRVKGDKAKLDKLMATLRIIAGYAKERFAADVEVRTKAKVNHLSARQRIQERHHRMIEAQAAEMEAAADRLRKGAGLEG